MIWWYSIQSSTWIVFSIDAYQSAPSRKQVEVRQFACCRHEMLLAQNALSDFVCAGNLALRQSALTLSVTWCY